MSRAWHEHRQPAQELDGIEHDARRPIAPRLPELHPHLPIVGQVDPILRRRWSERIATQPLKPIPVSRRHHQPRVQIETVPACVTAARLDGFILRP